MKRLALVFVSLLIVGCAGGSKTISKTEVIRPTFDWNPPESAAPASADVTFGVCGGSYAEKEDWIKEWPFNTFANNMANDFNELLTARGFTTTGPFRDMDELTYPDKKACDMILEPDLDVKVEIIGLTVEKHVNVFKDNDYSLNGEAAVTGRVNLSVLESLSGTRMWNKSIAIDRIVVPWKGENRYATPPVSGQPIYDKSINNALAGPLEKAYQQILAKAWTYLDPEEMHVVKVQAMEVKKKTTFSGNE